MPTLLLALLGLLSSAHAEGGSSDLRYFAEAAPGVAAAVESVLEITVSHRRKPSRGFRRLPFQPDANPDTEPSVDCTRLEPVPRARPRQRQAALEGFEICGVRLLHWTLGAVDRIELPVTAQKVEAGKRWLQVLLDPSINRRGWLQFAPGRKGVPLMRLTEFGDWITTSRHGTIPAHAARRLSLRTGPSEDREQTPLQLPSEGEDLPVDVLGVQGKWVRLSLTGAACERADDAKGSDDACPAGWTVWRADDGEPLLLP